jgi:hypothetical protein
MGSSVGVGSACCGLLRRDDVTGVYAPVTYARTHKRRINKITPDTKGPLHCRQVTSNCRFGSKVFRLSRALWTFNPERYRRSHRSKAQSDA